ncbi:MAG: type II secretion system GspH family protein [Candidatus Gastranaerophilales bacterium]|nr:type II secretion system GspH family protein [Candidatus Gastranaerophilales bacterium]
MKDGFTLSEVLIALVVIGVIAAITLPVIMANYRREEASARVKKFYSMLCNASTRAKADGNDWGYWAETGNNESEISSAETVKIFADEYLLPYLVYYKTEQSGRYYYIYLNDGTYFYIFKGTCIDFNVDVNGKKKPDKEGRDIFKFLYCPDSAGSSYKTGQIIPMQPKSITTREQALSMCKSTGGYCSTLLFMDGWQFKEDYPYSI